MEAHEWAKAYVEKLNAEIAEGREEEVAIRLSPRKQIETEERVKYNVGQLYLKKLYHQMRWDKIMKEIKEDSKAEIDLDAVVQMLLYQQTDYRRLIQMSFLTEEGEVSTQKSLAVDTEAIAREEQFDGFYGICTNLLPKSEKHPEGKTTLEIRW